MPEEMLATNAKHPVVMVVVTVMEDEVEEEEVGVVVEEVEVVVDQEVVVEVDAVVLEEGVGEVMTDKVPGKTEETDHTDQPLVSSAFAF